MIVEEPFEFGETPGDQLPKGRRHVDMAASDLGGNVEISQPGETIVTNNGVTVIGADNLPAEMPTSASSAYARNISALVLR